ncbi:MAG: cysteine rich repeat-containing protein [Leptospiraceae bacterium]|nr:cysteine rich repeat-containing protein [Leptospiraceae bacterium]
MKSISITTLSRISFAAGLLFVYSAVPLPAQSRGECRDDVARFCQNTRPGNGRVMNCLQSHASDLSPACRARVESWQKVRAACQEDVQAFCKDKSGAELQECIKANRPKFSNPCKSAVKTVRGM